MDSNLDATFRAVMFANGAASQPPTDSADPAPWSIPPIGRPVLQNAPASSRAPGLASGSGYLPFAGGDRYQQIQSSAYPPAGGMSAERGNADSPLDPRLMTEVGFGQQPVAGGGGANGVGGSNHEEAEGYVGYSAGAYMHAPESASSRHSAYAQSSSRTPVYPGKTAAGIKRSSSLASSRSRSRSPRREHLDGWIGEGFDSGVVGPAGAGADLHSLAAAAASMERDNVKPSKSNTSTRGKAGRSAISRSLLDEAGALASSLSTRSRKNGTRGWGVSTSDVRGNSRDVSADIGSSDGEGSNHADMDIGAPASKRRKVNKLDTALSMGSSGRSAGQAGESPMDAERTKEDIKRQKNREKQARLRNRRATELEMLQEMARNQRDQIKELTQTLATTKADRERERAEAKRQINAFKGWVMHLESVLTKEGKWTETADIRKKMKELHGLREDDMDVTGMENDFSGSRSQEYASSLRGSGRPTAHASPRFQQERRRAQSAYKQQHGGGAIGEARMTTGPLAGWRGGDGQLPGMILTRADEGHAMGEPTSAGRLNGDGRASADGSDSRTPNMTSPGDGSTSQPNGPLFVTPDPSEVSPGAEIKQIDDSGFSMPSPNAMLLSNLLSPPVFGPAPLKRVDSRTSAVSDSDIVPGSIAQEAIVTRRRRHSQPGEDIFVRSPLGGQ